VLISEVQLQLVHVQTHTMKKKTFKLVLLVLKSVPVVPTPHTTVVDVELTESTHQPVNVHQVIIEI
jgi:hypothetical protein